MGSEERAPPAAFMTPYTRKIVREERMMETKIADQGAACEGRSCQIRRF